MSETLSETNIVAFFNFRFHSPWGNPRIKKKKKRAAFAPTFEPRECSGQWLFRFIKETLVHCSLNFAHKMSGQYCVKDWLGQKQNGSAMSRKKSGLPANAAQKLISTSKTSHIMWHFNKPKDVMPPPSWRNVQFLREQSVQTPPATKKALPVWLQVLY